VETAEMAAQAEQEAIAFLPMEIPAPAE